MTNIEVLSAAAQALADACEEVGLQEMAERLREPDECPGGPSLTWQ